MDTKIERNEVAIKELLQQIKSWENKSFIGKLLSKEKISETYVEKKILELFDDTLFQQLISENESFLTSYAVKQFVSVLGHLPENEKLRIIHLFLALDSLEDKFRNTLNKLKAIVEEKLGYMGDLSRFP